MGGSPPGGLEREGDRTLRGGRCPRGLLPAGGPAFSGESRRKEHQGAQPPGPPLRKGGSFPKNLFSGGRVAGRLGLFFWQPACGPHSGRPQGEPPTTWAAGGRGSFPYGENGKNRNDKKKNSGKANMKADILFAHLPLCAHVCSQRVRTIGASRPIGGRLTFGARRCEGRRPLTSTEQFPSQVSTTQRRGA